MILVFYFILFKFLHLFPFVSFSFCYSPFCFKIRGDTISAGIINLLENDLVTIVNTEAFSQSFSLQYLQKFIKATALSKQAIVSMSPNNPLCVKYDVKITEEDSYASASLCFYLAPQLDDDVNM